MILLWFLLGIISIFIIARYNKSNKLFWGLLFPFIMGFTGAKMYNDMHLNKKQSNVDLTQVCPTQESISVIDLAKVTAKLESYTNMTPSEFITSKPVSQDYTPESCEIDATLSKVFGRTRDQPSSNLKPPELWLLKDLTTVHDTG